MISWQSVFIGLVVVTSAIVDLVKASQCLPIVTETSQLDDLTLLVTGTDLEVTIVRGQGTVCIYSMHCYTFHLLPSGHD